MQYADYTKNQILVAEGHDRVFMTTDPIGLDGGINLYLYTAGNPVNWVDPKGKNPIIAECFIDGILVIGAAICSNQIKAPDIDTDEDEEAYYDWLREREYQRYKHRCRQKPPEGLSQCDKWRWLLQREEDCAELMQQWDNRWEPGRHLVPIHERKRAAQKLADKIARLCCNE